MKKINIGGLLDAVSPEMVASYESLKLGGEKLQSVNDKYNSANPVPSLLAVRVGGYLMMLQAVVLTCFFLSSMLATIFGECLL